MNTTSKPTSEEIKKLIPFCQCCYHKISQFNPYRCFFCQCCVGCLESDQFSQDVYDKSLEAKDVYDKSLEAEQILQ